jgi:hypothetical protein
LQDVLEALKIRPGSAQAQNDLILLPRLKQQWVEQPILSPEPAPVK